MALAIDASTPALVLAQNAAGAPAVTASFTPPLTNTVLVAVVMSNAAASTNPAITMANSGTALTWTEQVRRAFGDSGAQDGATIIYTAPLDSSRSLTVSVSNDQTGDFGAIALDVYVVTGANTASPVGSVGEGSSTTSNISPTLITTTVNGSWTIGGASDWVGSGVPTSSDTGSGFNDATSGVLSGIAARKSAASSGVGTSVTLNFNGGAGSRQWNYAAVEIVPATAVAYPPQRQRRPRAVPLRVARSRQTVPVRAQVNPPIPVQEIRQARAVRGWLFRRGKLAQTIPPQFNPPYPFAETHPTRELRGYLIRRGKIAQTIPPQFNPPYPFSEIAQPRRLRGLPRRGRQSQPVPPQDLPVTETVQPRRFRGLLLRRGKIAQTVPPQFNPPFPWAEIVQPRRLRGVLLRRGRMVAPAQLDQLAPVQENAQPRRLRGILIRRGKLAQTVPPQLNPPFPFAEIAQPRRIRGLLARRGRQAQPVSGQVVVTPPAYPPQTIRSRVKAYRLFRGHQAQPVPAQQAAPVNPAFVPGRTRPRIRLAALRRGHLAGPLPAQDLPIQARVAGRACPVHGRARLAAPPPAQAAPVPVKAARRPLLGMLRRGAKALLPLKQDVPPAPPVFVPGPGRRRLMFLPARRGHQAAPPAVCECITHRPETGTTTRPATGTTAYATATTGRPSTGTTARPDTGTTKDPCC